MRLLALALFALCTADIAAIASKDASMDEQLAINAMLEAKVAALEATTTAQAGTNAALGDKITAMCAAVEEIPAGVRPAALEKVCSGAKTTDIQVFGDLGEGTLVGGCQNNQPYCTMLEAKNTAMCAAVEEIPVGVRPAALESACSVSTTTNNKTLGDLGEGMLLGGCQNNQSYCTINEAKCAGTGQNNTLVEGSLDCELDPKDDAHKGSACIDNLSKGKVHMYNAFNEGKCMPFNSEVAIFGVTQFSSDKNTVNKQLLAHPHMANRDIGVFAMKRMLCDDGGCSVFKAGYCVKCPGNVFANKVQSKATPKELGKFFDCCVMGQSTYTNTEDKTDDNECPSEPGWDTGAFTSPDGSPSNDPLATIHADYVCTNGDDAEKAMMLIKAM